MRWIDPDSEHGGILQFHDKFAPIAVEFLGPASTANEPRKAE